MRILSFLGLRSTIIFVVLVVLLFFLSLFSYFFNQLLILFVSFFVIFWLVRGIKFNRGSLRKILVIPIIFVTLWAAYNVSPRINFWVTSSARQSVVNRMIPNHAIVDQQEQKVVLENNSIENVLLGKATAYISRNHHSVYFDYYKRGNTLLNQAAFFVYTTDPTSIDPRHIQLKQLKNNWFFLLRTYAD